MLDPRLRHAVAVAQAGSFTAATQIAGVTQSALTKSVADLEQAVGYSIFHRSARGIVLTERGAVFIERAERLLADAQVLLSPTGEYSDPFAGVLRIGVGPASMEWFIVEATIRLQKRYPGVRFHISGASFERTIQQLRNGTLDIAIGFDAAFSVWSDVRRVRIGQLKSCLFVRPDHPLADLTPIPLQRLASFEIVSPSESKPYEQVFRALYENQGIEWQSKLHIVDFFPTVKEMVRNSDAIGVVDFIYASRTRFLENFRLLAVDLLPPSDLCAAVRAKWPPKPSARAFLELMRLHGIEP